MFGGFLLIPEHCKRILREVTLAGEKVYEYLLFVVLP
jgi:hypothetical protein